MQEFKQSDFEDLNYINLVMGGDKKVFEKIVTKYERLVFKLCYNFLGPGAEAEDTVQEIFLELYKSLGNFKLGKRFSPWLYAVALNVLRKKYKQNLRRKRLQNELLRRELPAEGNPVDLIEARETRRLVQEAVRSLPVNLQEVTLLYYMEDLSIKEICVILSLGEENVKSRLFRARKKLKKILIDVQL